MKNKEIRFPYPCMEPTKCYLTFQSPDGRLSMSRSGEVSLSDNRKEFEKWYLIPNGDGTTVIKSAAHGSVLAVSSDGRLIAACGGSEDDRKWRVERAGARCRLIHSETKKSAVACDGGIFLCEDGEATPWTTELLSGELCVLSNADADKRVSCSPFGNLKMSDARGGWEAWRFVESGDFRGELVIASWTHERKVLSSNPDGDVYTTEDRLGAWQKWTVRKDEGGVLIESVAFPGRLLSYDGNSLRTVSSRSEKTWGVHWDLDAANSNIFYISMPSRDKRLSSKSDCTAFADDNRRSWNEWRVEKSSSGGFTIFSCAHEKYLSSFSTGIVATAKDPAHIWDIEESSHGSVHFISREHKLVLHCDEDSNISTVSDRRGPSETWKLEPRMPRSLSRLQIWSMAGIGVGAIAAPFAVAGAVGALGFTASGISAGSLAASMMSAEAIAAGGGVAVGGTVATLQSVGAAGLGLAGTAAAAVGGGTLAGSVAGASGALKNEGSSKVVDTEQDGAAVILPSQHRPLCQWRSW